MSNANKSGDEDDRRDSTMAGQESSMPYLLGKRPLANDQESRLPKDRSNIRDGENARTKFSDGQRYGRRTRQLERGEKRPGKELPTGKQLPGLRGPADRASGLSVPQPSYSCVGAVVHAIQHALPPPPCSTWLDERLAFPEPLSAGPLTDDSLLNAVIRRTLDPDPKLRRLAASSQHATSFILAFLALDEDAVTRMKVAGNTATPSVVLEHLYLDPLDSVRAEVAGNPNVTTRPAGRAFR